MRSPRSGLPIGLLLLALASLALLGCASADGSNEDTAAPAAESPTATPEPGLSPVSRVLTVPEAIQAGDQPMKVRGYVLIGADGVARLCTGIAGSYPPQCGSPSVVLKGVEQEKLVGRESAGGVVWAGEATYRGVLKDGVFTLS
jgi:hypothetical protein